MLMQEESETWMPNVCKKNLQGVYSWNKMWSLKSLVIFKCESETSLHEVQYK